MLQQNYKSWLQKDVIVAAALEPFNIFQSGELLLTAFSLKEVKEYDSSDFHRKPFLISFFEGIRMFSI